ncbi:MAG TPA: TonB-dependent receptor [Niabella sp.]|nr:TonB-dependent receptor [Niabella sp.]HOZ96155.1 TonB-dependent receptor [Niabella sp.]HQW13520.1 TonB-dependent receptor [Niabella sp.]HQX18914.1 TonB-dependent receptor [Niabella sp.]HRB07453.1 TonB-dependent receptor [Niabella sp.]
MKPIAFLTFLFVLTYAANAQSIRGTLMDPVEGIVVKGATVQLLSPKDSNAVKSAVSDSSGSFLFRNVAFGAYVLRSTSIGFETLIRPISINDSLPDLDLDDVYIPKKTTTLEGVIILASAPAVSQKGDTIQLAASQFKTNPDATVEDLIKKMPGITVAKDGTVTAQGEQVKKVTVDGKDFFGDDVSTALRNLPSELVDKIQVFERLSDQAQLTGFDDGNSSRALNIVTRSGMKTGQFGRIFAGYGTDNRYYAGGNTSFFNGARRITLIGNFNNVNQQNFAQQDLLGVMGGGGSRGGGPRGGGFGGGFGGFGQAAGISSTNAFGINFSDNWGKKLSVAASYFYNYTKNDNESESFSPSITSEGKTLNLNSNSLSSSINNNHRFNLRFEYKLDSNNTIMYIPSWSFQNNNSNSSSYRSAIYDTGDSSYISDGTSRSHRDGFNIGNNLMYRHSFAKPGRTFSLSLRADYNKNDGYSYNLTNIDKFENINLAPVRNLYMTNPTNGSTYSARVNFTEPLGNKGIMELSYSPTKNINKRDQHTYDYNGSDYSDFNANLSNNFKNTITTHNGEINYRLGKSRDDQFSAGVSVQYSELGSIRIYPAPATVSQNFMTALPNLRWSKKLGKYSSMRLFYRTSTGFPSIDQLQDVVDSSSQINIITGNPNLKQSYTHMGIFRYTFANTKNNNSFSANISYRGANNYISTDVVNDKGITSTTFTNLNGFQNFNGLLVYAFPLNFMKTNFNITSSYNYSKTPSKYNHTVGHVSRNTYGSGVVLSSNINEYVDFTARYDLNYTQTSSTLNNASSGQNYLQQNPNIALNLLSKNGWFFNTSVDYQDYRLEGADDVKYTLWNAAIGKKFLPKKAGELRLSVFDILKQNNSFSQTLNNFNLIQTSTTRVLQQYFMLTFTYSLRNFGKGRSTSNQSQERPEWRGHGGAMPGGHPPMMN